MREMKPPRWSALTRQEDLFRWDDLSLRRATGRWGIRRISQPRDIPRSSSRYISSSVSACGITSLPSYCHHPAVLDCNARYSHLPPWCLVFCTRAIECLPFCSSLRKAYSWLRHHLCSQNSLYTKKRLSGNWLETRNISLTSEEGRNVVKIVGRQPTSILGTRTLNATTGLSAYIFIVPGHVLRHQKPETWSSTFWKYTRTKSCYLMVSPVILNKGREEEPLHPLVPDI